MARLRPVDFEDRLTLVEHLGELRTRIVISIVAYSVAFGLCFWQNSRLLDIANAPLPGDKTPITFGVAEPFTTTVTITAYAALVISLPVILYQAYAFILPALTDREKRVVVPFLMGVPLLFIAGVVFGYFVVLPAATKFLLNFNASRFNIQIRAKDYYSFVSLVLLAVAIVFQVPLFILGLVRIGVVSAAQLRRNWRLGIVIMTAIAVALPGIDPVTTLLEMVPLIALYLLSLGLAGFFERRWRPTTAAAER
jgi:sec-independent protein translocase protein TatC